MATSPCSDFGSAIHQSVPPCNNTNCACLAVGGTATVISTLPNTVVTANAWETSLIVAPSASKNFVLALVADARLDRKPSSLEVYNISKHGAYFHNTTPKNVEDIIVEDIKDIKTIKNNFYKYLKDNSKNSLDDKSLESLEKEVLFVDTKIKEYLEEIKNTNFKNYDEFLEKIFSILKEVLQERHVLFYQLSFIFDSCLKCFLRFFKCFANCRFSHFSISVQTRAPPSQELTGQTKNRFSRDIAKSGSWNLVVSFYHASCQTLPNSSLAVLEISNQSILFRHAIYKWGGVFLCFYLTLELISRLLIGNVSLGLLYGFKKSLFYFDSNFTGLIILSFLIFFMFIRNTGAKGFGWLMVCLSIMLVFTMSRAAMVASILSFAIF